MSNREILTIRKVVTLLRIGEKTAYTMAQNGELPGFKVRGQWRLMRGSMLKRISSTQVRTTMDITPECRHAQGWICSHPWESRRRSRTRLFFTV